MRENPIGVKYSDSKKKNYYVACKHIAPLELDSTNLTLTGYKYVAPPELYPKNR
ncbi:hypothetical protein [Flavobacterium sp. ov086]|uniref:hypothetical protein n=1 Tax=Flavobacterium sp. ov086 TaxID=1761785 RepID=UPI001595F819|nr:hypothetical protein [Flavobacterium sp. ov086]